MRLGGGEPAFDGAGYGGRVRESEIAKYLYL
jgi:hypothetical protein